jgi:hypothetical protein
MHSCCEYCDVTDDLKGHTVAQCIEALTTNRKAACSVPDEVIEFFKLT